MRRRAMRFHGFRHSKESAALDAWIDDATDSVLIPIMRFARVLRGDIHAVNNATELTWSNRQAEGQIICQLSWAHFRHLLPGDR